MRRLALVLLMASLILKARDNFTGGDTASLTGRTPDGGADPALAIGTWGAGVAGNGFGETIGIEDAVARVLFTGEPTGYQNVPLDVPGLPAKGYRAEAIVIFPTGTSDGGRGEVAVSHNASEETAYTFEVDGGGADDIAWVLYWVQTTAGVPYYTRLADPTPDTMPRAQGDSITFSLELTPDDVLIGVIDGVTVVTFDLTTDNAIDLGTPVPSILPAGLPALDIADTADAASPPGVTVAQFNVYFGVCNPGTGIDAAETLVARDDWTGGNDTEIDARNLDSGTGTWDKHPIFSPGVGDRFDILSGVLVSRGSGATYTVDGVPDPVGTQAVEAVAIFPSRDAPTGTAPGPFCHQDAEIGSVSSGTNPDTGNFFHQAATSWDQWTLWFLRPPNSTSITAETILHSDSYTDRFGIFIPAEDIFFKLFYEKDGAGVSRLYITITHGATHPYRHIYDKTHSYLSGSNDDIHHLPEYDYCNHLHFGFWVDGGGTHFYSRSNGSITSTAAVPISMDPPSYSSFGVTLYGRQADVPTGGVANENARVTIGMRWDPATNTGYYAQLHFFHAGVPTVLGMTLQLFAITPTHTYNLTALSGLLYAEHDRSFTLRFRISPDNILTLSLDGVDLYVFDLINDHTSSPVGGTAPLLASGRPMLRGLASNVGDMSITQFSVYDLTDAVPCQACVPGGGGGDPGGGGETHAFLWGHEAGAFRAAAAPSDHTAAVLAVEAGAFRLPAGPAWVSTGDAWRAMGTETTFVLDPTENPDVPCPQDGGLDPAPDPIPVGTKALGLYNLTRNLITESPYRYSPFNGAITGSSVGALPALLAAIAAKNFQCWFVPAFRQEQTQDHSGRGKYDHAATMTKFGTFSGFSDANSGVIPFLIPYDEPDCGLCWQGKPPTVVEVEEGCDLLNSIFGVPCAVRMSPRKMLALGWPCTKVRIGMAQWGGPGGFGVEGFGNDYDGYIAAQIAAATTLGLDGILWGLNPFRDLDSGWRTAIWTDAFLETVGLQAAAAGMNYGVYMWLGYPPSTRVMLPDTNDALQTIVAAL